MGTEAIIAIVVSNLVLGLWEHWLGSTEKVDANNTAQFVSGLAVKLFSRLKK